MTCTRCRRDTICHTLDDNGPQPYCALCLFLEIQDAELFGEHATVTLTPALKLVSA